MPSILFVAPQARFFLSHRLRLALDARERGYDVAVACPQSDDCVQFYALDIPHFDLPVVRSSRNPLRDLGTIRGLNRIFDQFEPDCVHLITAKATLYGGLLARMRGIPTVAAITGLGFLFTDHSPAKRAVRAVLLGLYRWGLNRPDCTVVFQNDHDRGIFERAGILSRSRDISLPGAGVDLAEIIPAPLPEGPPIVVLPARMLRMKGIEDFEAAARILQARGIEARFRLVGDPDPANPTSITRDELEQWNRQGLVEWEPHRADIAQVLAEAHIVALPSRGGEGLPKTLVDAAAAGRAAVSTRVPGCEDAIAEGVTGLLCQARNPPELAEKLAVLITDRPLIERMGAAARRRAEEHFDIANVVAGHIAEYDRLSAQNRD